MTSRTMIAVLLLIAGVAAHPWTVHPQPPQLAKQVPPAVRACVGCHGSQGEGNPAGGTPRIAGQSAYYLSQQLDSYANGSRRDPVMEPIARGLPPEVRTEVAAYYAQLDAPFDERGRPERPPERGRRLAMEGDDRLGVAACRNCHGPGGVGEPPNIPYLGGLDARYLAAELTDWKVGARTNDAGQQMFTVVVPLSAEDIDAVAQYYASLSPPKPAPLNLVQAPPPRQKVTAGTTSTAQPAGGSKKPVGIEQGAPTRGGTEGAGGTDASKDAGSGRNEGSGETNRTPPGTDPPGAGTPSPTTGSSIQWPRLSGRSNAAIGSLSSSPGDPVPDGDPARGREIIASGVHGCAACHSIPGIRAPRGVVGPPLGGMARRGFIAGQLPNTPDVLVAFLQNPPALVPATGMPDVRVSLEEARHIAAFLYTLEPSDAP